MTPISPVDWDGLLLAFMHCPVDRVLGPQEREAADRAARYAAAALGKKVHPSEIEAMGTLVHRLGALAEQSPLPMVNLLDDPACESSDGVLTVLHPVSGQASLVECRGVDESAVAGVIEEIVADLKSSRDRCLAVWRLLPQQLEAKLGWSIRQLPANPLVPDHSLLNQADIAAGIWASRNADHGGGYLSFALGPVQPFIEAARSVRDLWTGSAILSWLSFQAMRPIVEAMGPTAFIYPSLRGNPLMDLWLRNIVGLKRVPHPECASRMSPSLPSRFIAMVPWGPEGQTARRLAGDCEASAREAWATLAGSVRERLAPQLRQLSSDWDRLWTSQVSDYFEIRTTVAPERSLDDDALAQWVGGGTFAEVWPAASAIRSLRSEIPAETRPDAVGDGVGRWQAQMEFSARLMEVSRSVRHVPTSQVGNSRTAMSPPKCSVFGSWEQMGPANMERSAQFWRKASSSLSVEGVRLRKGERFCSVALAKRFAGPALLANQLEIRPAELRFPDTATVAASEWLKKAGIDPNDVRKSHHDWNGQWVYGSSGERAPAHLAQLFQSAACRHGQPPTYFAIVKIDGDDIGSWLSGDCGPRLGEVLHPSIVGYFRKIGGPAVDAALKAKRPVDAALHAAISDALGAFATRVAPRIVKRHYGTVIYSGGDDLLALLPAARAVTCARELQESFRGEDQADRVPTHGMGHRATVSAGIAYVHYKEDLRFALQATREAETLAKRAGKDILRLQFLRRSGEHAGALLPWRLAGWFAELTALFAEGASDRWAYRLRAQLPVLLWEGLPDEAGAAEIRRLGNRIEDSIWQQRAGDSSPGKLIEGWWAVYRDACRERKHKVEEPLQAFVTLCQGAAFVARCSDG